MASSPNIRRPAALPVLFRRFIPYTLRFSRRALLSGVFVVLAPLAAAGVLWSFKLLIDDVLVAGRHDALAALGLLYATLSGLKIALDFLTTRLEAQLVEDIGRELRTDLYRHLLSLAPGSLKGMTPGDVLARTSGDVERTEYLIYTLPLAVTADAAAAAFFIGLLFVLSPALALSTCVVVPAFLWLSYGMADPIRRASHLARAATARWMSFAEERLDALPLINSFDASEREAAELRRHCGRARDAEVTARLLLARQTAGIELVAAAGALIVLVVGATLIQSGSLSVGGLGAFIGAVWSAYAPLKALAKASGRVQHAAAGADRIAELFDIASLVSEKPAAKPLKISRGRLSFENIRFAYPGGREVLRGINLEVEPGETLAIVGPSGGGKSTLVRLALRLADPSAGRVLIDGQDLRDVTLSSLRGKIAPVFQDPFILSGTLASNIRYGAPAADEAHVRAVVKDSAVDGFAPEVHGGLALATGHRGNRLSGGQRQRLALARALLRDAPFLILDEATAAVDSETEDLIQDALDRLAGKRTLLVVAHRLSSIHRADRVVVVENGEIVECGTPEKLLAGASRCRSLFLSQLVTIEAAA